MHLPKRHQHPLRNWSFQRRHHPITEPGEGRDFLFDVLIPGAIAGTIGATVMALIYMPLSAAFGAGFWTLPKLMGGVLFRTKEVTQLGPQAVVVGLIVHYAVSNGLATGFALILPRRGGTMFAVIPLAIFYAMMTFWMMQFFVVEWASPLMRRELLHPLFFFAQCAWGACLAIIPIARIGYETVSERTPWPLRHRAHA